MPLEFVWPEINVIDWGKWKYHWAQRWQIWCSCQAKNLFHSGTRAAGRGWRELLAKCLRRKWNTWEYSLTGKRTLLSLVYRPKAPGVRLWYFFLMVAVEAGILLGFVPWHGQGDLLRAGDASVEKPSPSQSQEVLMWKTESFKGFLIQIPLAWTNSAQRGCADFVTQKEIPPFPSEDATKFRDCFPPLPKWKLQETWTQKIFSAGQGRVTALG